MKKRRKNKKTKSQNKRNKPLYKGPYHSNPNIEIQNIKKSMRPESEGPTVDTFSDLDSTTNVLPNEENDIRHEPNHKRPTKERNFSFSIESIILTIFGFVAIGIGIIVYNHSNKFVAVEKDIDYIQTDIKEQKTSIKEISEKTNNIDKKVDLINLKIDIDKSKNR